jgi:glycosyltransferase involved in cell wall biosynthesis
MTMRILQVVDSLDPIYGGPPTVVLRLAAALAREGAQVTLYSQERSGRESDIAATLRGIPGIELVRRVSDVCDGRVDRLMGRPARDFLRRPENKFDVVHIHGLWRPGLAAILKESFRRSCPYVITPHGMLARWSLAQKPLRKKVALALTWRTLIQQASFVHALTQAEARDFAALGIACPVDIVPNGFFLEEMGELPPPGSYYAAHPELGGQPFILFLGRLHYVKRVDWLVRAFAKLAATIVDVHLVLAGPDCGTRPQIEQEVEALGIGNRVHFVGPLYGAQKYAAMVDARCFCQPSVYETFSMAILEAMACGLPPVITRGCNFDEIETSGAGLVADSEDDLVAALGKLCTDADARVAAAKKARDLVVAKYTWPVVARQMLARYQARLQRQGAGGEAARPQLG